METCLEIQERSNQEDNGRVCRTARRLPRKPGLTSRFTDDKKLHIPRFELLFEHFIFKIKVVVMNNIFDSEVLSGSFSPEQSRYKGIVLEEVQNDLVRIVGRVLIPVHGRAGGVRV